MIVAIDGPAGAGKSTVARAVAARLGFAFLDTGALYRCAVLYGLRRGLPPEDVVGDMDVRLGERVLLGGEDVTSAIREPHISRLTPAAAANPQLRQALTDKQRGLLAHGDWVAEGRDIGTVVVPDAEVKVFLTASVQARAQRRAGENGENIDDVRLALEERDQLDSIREHGRLYAAPDAIEIDTTDMGLTDAIDAVVALVPHGFTQTPALFAISPEGVAPPGRRRRRPRDPATG
jgi:CMP/dCMP kinase